ncbi:hypothetical protein FRC07_011798 [Ceratobasidium sp. 392]|nr:hypothetical protein FRC07_011798 [Ceratobasidium sp. 392]
MLKSNGNVEHMDYYALLGVPQNASITDIKQSYRIALLKAHPDKHPQQRSQDESAPAIVISRLQDAFRTLTDPDRRATYDQLLKEGKGKVALTPVTQRPAHEVSLDEFELEEVAEDGGDIAPRWSYSCRCGGLFTIEERELEEGVHYIGCNGCSEVVWVGYEVVDDVQVSTPSATLSAASNSRKSCARSRSFNSSPSRAKTELTPVRASSSVRSPLRPLAAATEAFAALLSKFEAFALI